ncbi:acid phosphatase type 7, partial [Phenoliferia sp. Uapishka_3]
MLANTLLTLLALLSTTPAASTQVTELPPIPKDFSTPVQVRLAFNGPHDRSTKTTKSIRQTLLSKLSRQHAWQVMKAPTPSPLVIIDMGVFGPDGLSERNVSYTGKAITNSLSPGEHTTIDRLVKDQHNYDFVVHPGDFAYADAWLKEELINYINGTLAQGPEIYEGLNEQFWQQLSAVSAIKPYMVTAGNHEANCDNGGTKGYNESICPVGQRDFAGFINRFGTLLPASSTTTLKRRDDFPPGLPVAARKLALAKRAAALGESLPPFFYSFDSGMVHYIMFDTETDLGNGLIGSDETGGIAGDTESMQGSYTNQQVDWLAKDLAAVDRKLTPWVVAAGHHGMSTETAFEGLFVKYGVDVVLHGHVHNMQLVAPIKNGTVDPAGFNNPSAPAYVINGAAGHFEGLDALGTLPSYTTWSNDVEYGYSKLSFKSRTQMEISFIGSNSGDVLEAVQLYKHH